jgi:hypothetical protein
MPRIVASESLKIKLSHYQSAALLESMLSIRTCQMGDNEGMSTKPTTPKNTLRNTRKLTPEMEARKWKPGQPSPNPHGRPRTKLLSEAYRLVLADLERRGDRSVAEKIAEAMARKAMKGNIPAARELADRTEGRAVQAVRIEPEIDEATALRLFDLAERLGL